MNCVEKVNAAAWDSFLAKWRKLDGYGFEKYFDLAPQFQKYEFYLAKLALDTGPAVSVLDISAGFGVFAFMCKCHGHSVSVTDVKNEKNQICLEAQQALELPECIKHDYYVNNSWQFAPLPADIGSFDVITAFACAPQSRWSTGDWIRFIDDSVSRLNTGGRLLLVPNRSAGFDLLFKYVRENLKLFEADEKKGYCLIWK